MAHVDLFRSKATSPFVNPDPEFIVAHVGPLHTLILSKFCVYRPSYLLHTNDYVPQKDDLNEADIAATWLLLGHLRRPQMALFNCGAEAGASQSHKHIQLLPRPLPPGPELFPDRAQFSSGKFSGLFSKSVRLKCAPVEPDSIEGVPYIHYVIGIPIGATALDVHGRYRLLLDNMRESLGVTSFAAYNLVMVKEWMIVIPRRHAAQKTIRANGAGMMGFVWVQDIEERNGWTQLGMTKVLTHMGVPVGRRI
jgi:ATP adenylyltransferase